MRPIPRPRPVPRNAALSASSIAVVMFIVLILVGLLLWTPDLDRTALEAKYLAAPTDLIEVAGARLHVRDSGPRDASAIVLLHGFGSSLQTWDAWIPRLAARHRVVRFDLPGSGLSDPDATGDYTDARSVAVLAALMDRLGIARATVVGNSMGGRIAWTFAAAHPERVACLVLISPDGFASPGFEYGQRPKVGVAVEAMRFVLPKPLVRMSLAPAYADPAALTDERLERYYDLLRAPGARSAMIARMAQGIRFDPVERLRSIAAPTLLLWGEDDHLIPFSNAADYERAIPDVTLAPFAGVGHLPQEEAPDRSLDPLLRFIDR